MSLCVADHWYETRRYSDGVTLIWEPFVVESVRCNIWHVQGRERDLLIDSGMGIAPLRSGVALLRERDIVAVASHAHYDHVGGYHEFSQRLIHPAEADIVTAPNAENTVWAPYARSGVLEALPRAGYDIENYAVQAAPPTRLIEEGDEIDLGDRMLKVFHLPGHSPGSIALYEPDTRTLFTGDVIYDGPLFDHLYHSDVKAYLESMARLREIPARTFHCGHHASFGRERLLELIDAYVAKKMGVRKDG